MDDMKNMKWSNRKCISIAFGNNFPSTVKDTNIQKAIISRFLNFYLTGKVQKGLNITDLIFAVVSIMPFSSGCTDGDMFIWNDEHYSDDGTLFFLSPDEKLQYDIKMSMNNRRVEREKECAVEDNVQQNNDSINSIPDNEEMEPTKQIDLLKHKNEIKVNTDQDEDREQVSSNKETNDYDSIDSISEYDTIEEKSKSIKWLRLKSPNRTNVLSAKNIQYGPVENARFCISCNKLLDQWENLNARQVLKYFFGVTALVLMRAITKATSNLEAYFSNKFTNLVSTEIFYSPPHKSCITKTWKMFRKHSTPDMQTMFAKLVINSFYIDKKRYNEEILENPGINIFRASVLTHIANNAMGLVNMLQVIALNTNNMFYLAFESLKSDETRDSWEHVKQYIDNYLSNDKEHTHHWARLIDPEEFQDLCCINNYELAVVTAVFIEKLTNSEEIWNSGWAKNKTSELVQLKTLGYQLYSNYKERESAVEKSYFSKLELMFKNII